jgi:hypothetical protein
MTLEKMRCRHEKESRRISMRIEELQSEASHSYVQASARVGMLTGDLAAVDMAPVIKVLRNTSHAEIKSVTQGLGIHW